MLERDSYEPSTSVDDAAVLAQAIHGSMAPSDEKRTMTLIVDAETDRLLNAASRRRGVSRSEFIRAHLCRVLEQDKPHPKPRSSDVVKRGPAVRDGAFIQVKTLTCLLNRKRQSGLA
jgi:hypothetical protein